MALEQWVAWCHSGAGTDEQLKQLKLPDNIFVAFYVPPGRQLGRDLGLHVFEELNKSQQGTDLDEIDQFHQKLRGNIRTIKRTGNTPVSALELHSALNFTDWPRIVGKGRNDTQYLLNYSVTGATAKEDKVFIDNMGLWHLGSGPVMRFQDAAGINSMKDILDKIEKDSAGADAILHFLGCREQAAVASQFGGLFAEDNADPNASRQQIRLKKP